LNLDLEPELKRAEEEEGPLPEPRKIARELQAMTEGGSFDVAIDRFKNNADSVGDQFGPKVTEWLDGVTKTLFGEKEKLKKLAKRTVLAIRKKEFEFATKIKTIQMEKKKDEESIKHLEMSLSRSKDQISQAAINMERIKASSHCSQQEIILKKKIQQTRDILEQYKKENIELKTSIAEMKNQVLSASKKQGPSVDDLSAIQKKYEHTKRQFEDARRDKMRLLERAKQAEKKANINHVRAEDLNKKVDILNKQAFEQKRTYDELRAKVTQLERENLGFKQKIAQGDKSSAA
jgi:chromosome segregation ATPase